MRIAVVATCLLAACGSKKEAGGGGPTCDERAARMAARLGPLADEPGQMMTVPEGLTPIESSRGEPIDRPGPIVMVRKDGALELAGQPAGGPEQLRELLAMELERAARYPPDHLYVLADREAPASAIAAVLAARPPELTARLAVRGPARPAEPYDDALRALPSVVQFDAEMDKADPGERATRLAKTMEAIVARCPPMIRLYGAVAVDSAESKARTIANGTPPAMRECSCRLTDPDLFEYALLKLFGAFDTPMRSLPLTAVPTDARTAAELAR